MNPSLRRHNEDGKVTRSRGHELLQSSRLAADDGIQSLKLQPKSPRQIFQAQDTRCTKRWPTKGYCQQSGRTTCLAASKAGGIRTGASGPGARPCSLVRSLLTNWASLGRRRPRKQESSWQAAAMTRGLGTKLLSCIRGLATSTPPMLWAFGPRSVGARRHAADTAAGSEAYSRPTLGNAACVRTEPETLD